MAAEAFLEGEDGCVLNMQKKEVNDCDYGWCGVLVKTCDVQTPVTVKFGKTRDVYVSDIFVTFP